MSKAQSTIENVQATEFSDPLKIRGFAHVEFIVEDAKAWRDFYVEKYGMYLRAFGDSSTGLEGKKSYLVGQGRINFIFSQAEGSGDVADFYREHYEKHGNGVRDVAFRVEDARSALVEAVDRGAEKAYDVIEGEEGGFVASGIKTYGDTIHTFVQRDDHASLYFPGMVTTEESKRETKINLAMIDHIVANVEVMDEWADFYHRIFGFDQTRYFDINTGKSALMSKVMGNEEGYIKMPINEPSSENSQIQEYLDEYNGPGVQHIALLTPNILDTIEEMRGNDIEFLDIPDTYYDPEQFAKRGLGDIDEDLDELKRHKILADCDEGEKGYLLQIFTKCFLGRFTFFHEIIQRKGGAKGFGEGNFTALFEAIEREQERRGTL